MKLQTALLPTLLLVAFPLSLHAQQTAQVRQLNEMPTALKRSEEIKFKHQSFTFVRIRYGQTVPRKWNNRTRWATDYPDADLNFSARFRKETGLDVDPNGMVLDLTDPKLKQQPFIYLAEGGDMQFTAEQVKSLREYLLGGGFLMVDDFWGEEEWNSLAREFRRVFPDREPIDLPLTHEVFRSFYEIRSKPQVPNVIVGNKSQFTGITWERDDAKEAHYRGLFDDNGRLMVIFCHNTDLGDGWERSSESDYYNREFSLKKAYPMGINIVVYALTH